MLSTVGGGVPHPCFESPGGDLLVPDSPSPISSRSTLQTTNTLGTGASSTSSKEDPATASQPPVPHVAPPASPDAGPQTPIVAYCIAFEDDFHQGCLLKVASAEPGASMVYRLESTMGENVTAVVRLAPQATVGGYIYNTRRARTRPLAFQGTVEYEGYPNRTWPVGGDDPTAVRTPYVLERKPFGKLLNRQYLYKVRMDGDKVVTIRTRTYLNLSPPPPPPLRIKPARNQQL